MSERGLWVTLVARLLVIEEEREKEGHLTVTVAELHPTWPVTVAA